MTVLSGARVVTSDGVLDPGWIEVDDGVVADVGTGRRRSAVDLGDAWLVPGFVDLHVHGGGGADFLTDDPDEALRALAFHRRHGTTTLIASVLTAPAERMLAATATLAGLVEQGELAGVHLEGPFLSHARCGAQDPRFLLAPDPALLQRLLDAGRGAVRVVTLAPELPGALELIPQILAAGAVAAIGHTDGGHEQTAAALDAGARLLTHLHNGMNPGDHRRPGPAATALADERVVCELINDGAHVHDVTARVAFLAAGPERIALITDAIAAAGTPDGPTRIGQLDVVVRDGVATLADGSSLAGSTLTMDRAVRRAVRALGVALPDAVRAATTTPARVLSLEPALGRIAVGARADLVVLDGELSVRAVMRGGRWVGDAPR